jgi:hypothetical protein
MALRFDTAGRGKCVMPITEWSIARHELKTGETRSEDEIALL